MIFIDWGPIAISLFAVGFSIYTYRKHDKKIKDQTKLINDFTLEKLTKEKELEKKAIVEVHDVRYDKGKKQVRIYNRGKATAKNVRVSFPGDPNVLISNYPSPIDIKPQNSIEIIITIYIGSPDTIQVNYEWEDGIKLDNRDSQTIHLR